MNSFMNDPELELDAMIQDGLRVSIEQILHSATEYHWSLQGMGMLRLYLTEDKSMRLHIWDSRYRTENVSLLHTHPWDFLSYVIEGRLINQRYAVSPAEIPGWAPFNQQRIFCGEGGGLEGEPETVYINTLEPELYGAGFGYHELSHEIHCSVPQDGTVTLVKRYFKEDSDHAHVFWPQGEEWVTAEPRRATDREIVDICRNSLETWFDGSHG